MLLKSGISTHRSLNNYSRIGIFDSGVGGLSVLRLMQKYTWSSSSHPQFIYVGDTARCPYGDRSPEEICCFVRQITGFLTAQAVDAIVIACNTSAAVAYDAAKSISTVPLFDPIQPTAQYVAQMSGKIGVMATTSTAKSKAFSKAIHSVNPLAEVIELSCPELVPIVESGSILSDETRAILLSYACRLKELNIKNLILGCTHFPFLLPVLKDLLPDGMIVIDPAEILLSELGYGREEDSNGHSLVSEKVEDDVIRSTTFYVTGSITKFSENARVCLGYIPGTLYGIRCQESGLDLLLQRDFEEVTQYDQPGLAR